MSFGSLAYKKGQNTRGGYRVGYADGLSDTACRAGTLYSAYSPEWKAYHKGFSEGMKQRLKR